MKQMLKNEAGTLFLLQLCRLQKIWEQSFGCKAGSFWIMCSMSTLMK